VKLLLDTHVLLWWLQESPRLPRSAYEAINDPVNLAVVSAATVWEAAIKRNLGKLDSPDDLAAQLAAHRFTSLSVTVDHAEAAGALPRLHDDPFDRMLAAQAMAEGLTLVTLDRRLGEYGADILPV
jgi:PIN domain nuclease of toxin-antitoxin system